jgi:hypothetical protein
MVFLPGLDDGGMLVEAGIGRKDLNQPPDWWFQPLSIDINRLIVLMFEYWLKRATAWIDDSQIVHPNLWDAARLTFTFFLGAQSPATGC